jgi:hypothetical protein
MAKPKGTGIPSYERICVALAATEEFAAYERDFVKRVLSARVDNVSFEKLAESSRGDGMPEHRFEVACGKDRIAAFSFREPGKLKIDVESLVTAESLIPVMAVFGKKVRTFNCREELVKDKFVKHARQVLLDRHPGIIAEAEARISEQAQGLLTSGRVDKDRQVAYENEAVEEIRTVLLKYRNIRREALKRAIDEFIIHDVTEH